MLIVVLTPKGGIAFKMHTTVQLGIQISSETATQAPRGLIVRRYGCLYTTHTLTRGPRQQMLEHPLSQTFSPRLFGDYHLPDKQCAGLVGQKVTRDKAHQLIVLKDSHSGVGKVCALQQIEVGRDGVEGGAGGNKYVKGVSVLGNRLSRQHVVVRLRRIHKILVYSYILLYVFELC